MNVFLPICITFSSIDSNTIYRQLKNVSKRIKIISSWEVLGKFLYSLKESNSPWKGEQVTFLVNRFKAVVLKHGMKINKTGREKGRFEGSCNGNGKRRAEDEE